MTPRDGCWLEFARTRKRFPRNWNFLSSRSLPSSLTAWMKAVKLSLDLQKEDPQAYLTIEEGFANPKVHLSIRQSSSSGRIWWHSETWFNSNEREQLWNTETHWRTVPNRKCRFLTHSLIFCLWVMFCDVKTLRQNRTIPESLWKRNTLLQTESQGGGQFRKFPHLLDDGHQTIVKANCLRFA